MKDASGSGRPRLRRNKTAGENLHTALKFLGKTWRKDVDNPSHVRNWINWSDSNLPSSPTTIDSDMREGVPEKRIALYAQCLGLTPEILCSPSTDMIKLLSGGAGKRTRPVVYMPPGFRERYSDHGLEYNRPTYIRELFALMGGVYRMDYLIQGVDLIHRCALWFHGVEAHRVLVRGTFVMFGNVNNFEAEMFRWHNNLHTHYLCENGLELGYTLTVDPLRHNIVRQRNPFWLSGTGMTDRGLEDNQPVTFIFRLQKLALPKGMPQEELWQQEREDLFAHPFTAPGEADYTRLYSEIANPPAPL